MNHSIPDLTIGLGLGDRYSQLYALDAYGEWLQEGRLRTTTEALNQGLEALTEAQVAMETSTHSPWVSRLVANFGLEVIVPSRRVSDCQPANGSDFRPR